MLKSSAMLAVSSAENLKMHGTFFFGVQEQFTDGDEAMAPMANVSPPAHTVASQFPDWVQNGWEKEVGLEKMKSAVAYIAFMNPNHLVYPFLPADLGGDNCTHTDVDDAARCAFEIYTGKTQVDNNKYVWEWQAFCEILPWTTDKTCYPNGGKKTGGRAWPWLNDFGQVSLSIGGATYGYWQTTDFGEWGDDPSNRCKSDGSNKGKCNPFLPPNTKRWPRAYDGALYLLQNRDIATKAGALLALITDALNVGADVDLELQGVLKCDGPNTKQSNEPATQGPNCRAPCDRSIAAGKSGACANGTDELQDKYNIFKPSDNAVWKNLPTESCGKAPGTDGCEWVKVPDAEWEQKWLTPDPNAPWYNGDKPYIWDAVWNKNYAFVTGGEPVVNPEAIEGFLTSYRAKHKMGGGRKSVLSVEIPMGMNYLGAYQSVMQTYVPNSAPSLSGFGEAKCIGSAYTGKSGSSSDKETFEYCFDHANIMVGFPYDYTKTCGFFGDQGANCDPSDWKTHSNNFWLSHVEEWPAQKPHYPTLARSRTTLGFLAYMHDADLKVFTASTDESVKSANYDGPPLTYDSISSATKGWLGGLTWALSGTKDGKWDGTLKEVAKEMGALALPGTNPPVPDELRMCGYTSTTTTPQCKVGADAKQCPSAVSPDFTMCAKDGTYFRYPCSQTVDAVGFPEAPSLFCKLDTCGSKTVAEGTSKNIDDVYARHEGFYKSLFGSGTGTIAPSTQTQSVVLP